MQILKNIAARIPEDTQAAKMKTTELTIMSIPQVLAVVKGFLKVFQGAFLWHTKPQRNFKGAWICHTAG